MGGLVLLAVNYNAIKGYVAIERSLENLDLVLILVGFV